MRVIRGYEQAKRALERHVLFPWDKPPQAVKQAITRVFGEPLSPQAVVTRILQDVRRDGDRAVRKYGQLIDGVEMESLEVPREMWEQAWRALPRPLLRAFGTACRRVRAFHEASLPRSWLDLQQGYGELITPLSRVGIYVPGGTAAYPSTVLMTVIPARVAGVQEIVLASPSRNGAGPHPLVLAAASLVGVDRVFAIGGAQAIGALAYGTETVPQVDMICGPGNLFVTLAKRMVYGEVAVDGLYGPTETVLIADASALPAHCAADLLAQAEHDVAASPVLITTSARLVTAVEQELRRRLRGFLRREIAEQALASNGLAVLVANLEEAIDLANLYAPEHLCLLVEEPWALISRVRNAGAVFLGHFTPEVLGDYTAGPSHVMPTGGTARFGSALGVRQFLKSTALVAQDKRGFNALAQATATIARLEGLHGHADAVEARRKPRAGAPPKKVKDGTTSG
ncbi:MAG: histidinol dehydrogenase [Chloroflexi bacterium]|nr:histidinol dehydrogenase [Chloroflexota bacterium]